MSNYSNAEIANLIKTINASGYSSYVVPDGIKRSIDMVELCAILSVFFRKKIDFNIGDKNITLLVDDLDK